MQQIDNILNKDVILPIRNQHVLQEVHIELSYIDT